MKTRHWLGLILIVYFAIGTSYILLNPLWESPDEIHHYPMVQYVQTHNLRLPSQEIGTVGLWQQEGNQPPLYYILGAILTLPIDTSNINEVMRVNPHADIGIIRPDGNFNRLVHHPEREAFPSTGAILASYILRFFSLFLGAVTILVTYYTAKLIFPNSPAMSLGAAGINAFIPMFIYISASVSNDNLSSTLANLLIMILMTVLLNPKKPSSRTYIIIGIVTGAGLLSKLNIGLLIPVVAMVLLIISIRHRDWKPFIIGGFVSGGLTILIAGWWYWRNFRLYGDPTGLERFLDIVGRRTQAATLTQLWTERESFILTFWGLFGSISVRMSDMVYLAFNWIGGFALLSSILVFTKKLIREKDKRIAIALPIFWSITVLIAVMRWSSITPASQGRLIYGAMSSICLLMASGIGYWFPEKIRGWLMIIIIGLMAIIAALQPFITIVPAYAFPDNLGICDSECPETETVFSSSEGSIALYNSYLESEAIKTGDTIQFEVDFAMIKNVSSDWSIFVHVVSPEEIILAQRDVYPAGGLLATSDLEQSYSWSNFLAIYIPETTFAPTTAEIRLGWYNLSTGERMILADGSEMALIGTVDIVPSDLRINFDNQIELIDYDISTLVANSGDALEVTFYWRRLQPITADYVVFANIIDPLSLSKYADSNAMPIAWTRPTSTWEADEIIVDTHTLTISPDAPDGIFQIELGLYLQDDGFPRLPIIGTYDNFLYLTPFRIESETLP